MKMKSLVGIKAGMMMTTVVMSLVLSRERQTVIHHPERQALASLKRAHLRKRSLKTGAMISSVMIRCSVEFWVGSCLVWLSSVYYIPAFDVPGLAESDW